MFKKMTLYIEVYQGEVKSSCFESGKSYSQSCSGLSHPRMLMGDFLEVQACFKDVIAYLHIDSFLSRPPRVIVHLFDQGEGGYTAVEIKAFHEAALGAGAGEVIVVDDANVLTQGDILEGRFHQIKPI